MGTVGRLRAGMAFSISFLLASCGGTHPPPICVDHDRDGYGVGCVLGIDCDDQDPLITSCGGLPPAHPVCIDHDGDGYGVGCARGIDCDDQDPRIHPGAPEFCSDGIDSNCDHLLNQPDCRCHTGAVQGCYTGPPGTEAVGECRPGQQTCDANGMWGACTGEVTPTAEVCGDDLDNDCNAINDNGCPCPEGLTRPCSSNVGECLAGTELCQNGSWTVCTGILPTTEVCDGKDNDCDGLVDEGVMSDHGLGPPKDCDEHDWRH